MNEPTNYPDDQQAFLDAMDDVRPNQRASDRIALKKNAQNTHETIERRRAAALEEEETAVTGLTGSAEHIELLDPMSELAFKRPGIQNGVYRNLRLGKYPVEARLDLHKMSVDYARKAVYQFVLDCLEHDIRCALISHGKGEGRNQPPLIKSCLSHWLPQLDTVQAFHSAQKQHGGLGATYVMLRKSEKKRIEDWERHQKRRG